MGFFLKKGQPGVTSGETPIDVGSKFELDSAVDNESYLLGVQGGIIFRSFCKVGDLDGKEIVRAGAALVFEPVEME